MKMVLGYNFPDDATDDEIQEALKSVRGSAPDKKPIADVPQPSQPMSWGEYGKGVARSVGSGLTFGFGDDRFGHCRTSGRHDHRNWVVAVFEGDRRFGLMRRHMRIVRNCPGSRRGAGFSTRASMRFWPRLPTRCATCRLMSSSATARR
jgi:hypothetical protein